MFVEVLLFDSDLEICEVLFDDVYVIVVLYVWYVFNGCVFFEEIFFIVDEMCKWIQIVCDNGLLWLVVLWCGVIVGYCYVIFYCLCLVYCYIFEELIYVEFGMGGCGIGSVLLFRLIVECEKGLWWQMLVIIGDGYNNVGLLVIYKKFGFIVVGQLCSVGYKMGDWWDMLIMQCVLGDGDWMLLE